MAENDVARLRADKTGCAEPLHFSSAGAARLLDCVHRAVIDNT